MFARLLRPTVCCAGRLARPLQRAAFSQTATAVPPPSDHVYDVAIVGGGSVGSSAAYWLSQKLGCKPNQIVVIEKDDTYQKASSALSATAIRHQFSTPDSIAMCQFGTYFLRNSKTLLRLSDDEEGPDMSFEEGGYLFLATEKGEATMRQLHVTHKKHNVDTVLLTPEQMKAKYPWLNTSDIKLGSFGQTGEGWFDGYSLMMGLRKRAQVQNVRYVRDEVVGINQTTQGSKRLVTGVRLKGGDVINAKTIINCAGRLASPVSEMIGTPLPIRPRKRCIFVFECRNEQVKNAPFLIDPTGPYFRPEGKYFLAGYSPKEENDPDAGEDFEVNHWEWDEIFWPTLANRVPAFEAVKVINSWAGHYEMNTFDHNGIIGRHPEVSNFYYCCGFSGHGLMQSPASGRGIAELLLEGRFKTIDLSAFRYERIPENKPIVETAVL